MIELKIEEHHVSDAEAKRKRWPAAFVPTTDCPLAQAAREHFDTPVISASDSMLRVNQDVYHLERDARVVVAQFDQQRPVLLGTVHLRRLW